jgi:hypothetical protein
MNDIPLTLFSGGAIAAATIFITFFTWLGQRAVAHQGQIKHLEEKIDHLGDKIDFSIKHMDEKIDKLMGSHDQRISRLEKYFDVIMQTQIKKNKDQFSMKEGH